MVQKCSTWLSEAKGVRTTVPLAEPVGFKVYNTHLFSYKLTRKAINGSPSGSPIKSGASQQESSFTRLCVSVLVL